MRIPRVRFTVRRMMIGVSLIAIMIYGEQTRRRWLEYRDKFEQYDSIARSLERLMDGTAPALCSCMGESSAEERAMSIRDRPEWMREGVAYVAAMRDKYAVAMRRPWLSVEPDPDETFVGGSR